MASVDSARAYLRQRKPKLLRTFEDLHAFIGNGPATPADIPLHLALASEFVLIPTTTIGVAVEREELEYFAGLAHTLAQSSPACAAAFADSYPALEYPLLPVYPSLSRFALSDLGSVRNAAGLLRLSLNSASGDRASVYLNLFTEMIANSPGTVSEFIESFDSMRRKYSPAILEEWLKRGADLISSGRTEAGVQHLLVKSRESRLKLGITTAVLEDLRKVLQIYCTSIAGKSVTVSSVAISTFGLREPYTDGRVVYLPPQIGYFTSVDGNETAYTAIAALQAAQLDLGSYTFGLEKIPFQTDIQARYGLVLPDVMEHVNKQYEGRCQTVRERSTGETEVVFAGDRVVQVLNTPHEKFFYRFPTPDLMKELFSLLEGYRIERRLSSRYPGLRDDFARLNSKLLSTPPPVQAESGSGFVECAAQLIRLCLGDDRIRETGRRAAVIDIVKEQLSVLAAPNAEVLSTALASFSIYNALYDTFPIIPWCRRNDVRSIFRPTAKTCFHPEIVLDISPEFFPGVESETIPVDLEEQDVQDIDLTSFTQTERKAHRLREAILGGDVRVYKYPEYDADRGRTHQKYCTLYESCLEDGEADFYHRTVKQHIITFKRLKKRFLMMQPEELELSRRWLQGDEIHLADAFDFATDLMRGGTPDSKIYLRRKRNRRDIVAAILLDASSSTEEKVDGASIISVEKRALCLLAGVLSPIGDSFGIFSYFSMGRHNNFYMVAKDFHEKWNEKTQGRIAGIEASSSNRDGCAIRHTTARLLERPEKTKLLLLLSDGIPADAGYGSAEGSATTGYAIEDTRRAVIDARSAGVVPYCITIDRTAKSYIPRLYGDYHYTVIQSVTELPEKLSRLYLRLTR